MDGSADDLNETLTRSTPAASRVTVSAAAWYDIEAGYDFLYGEYSTDGGQTWSRAGNAVDGSSNGRWSTLRFSYRPGGAGSMFRFRYQTDGGVHLDGAFLDDLKVTTDSTTETDDVESGAGAWTPTQQWKISTGTETAVTPQYYLLENREYAGFDETLAEGPYQFSKPYTAPDWVEFFRFQNGMLVWYVDHSFEDNNTSEHAGGGLALPVDARPALHLSRRHQAEQPAPAVRRHLRPREDRRDLPAQGGPGEEGGHGAGSLRSERPAKASFTDSVKDAYWDASNPQNSVKVAGQTRSDRHGHERRDDDLVVSVTNPAGSSATP